MKRLAVALLLLIAVGGGIVLLARLGAEASPATFTVDSTGDGGDSNTADAVCDDGSGNCTLRAACGPELDAAPRSQHGQLHHRGRRRADVRWQDRGELHVGVVPLASWLR
jgi:hypothetical protein